MKNFKRTVFVLILITLSAMGVDAQTQRRPNRLADRQVANTLTRLEQNSQKFRNSLDGALDRSRRDGTRAEDDVNSFVSDFDNSIDQLRERFNGRRSVAADVQSVLQKATLINEFVGRNRLNVQTQNNWAAVRTDLNALANAYGVSWQWNRQTIPAISSQPYRLSDRELGQLIGRIENGSRTFRASLNAALDRSRYDGSRREDNINEAVRNFTNATDQLRNRFNTKRSVAADVDRVLVQATAIETFMRNNRLTTRAQNDWSTVRGDLDALASTYGVASNWENISPGTSGTGPYGVENRLTGTFRLDASSSDDPRDIANRATKNLRNSDRQRVYDYLLARLEGPDTLAIDRRGSAVTIASSRAPQSTFEADGRARQEQLPNGTQAQVTATLRGDQLVINSSGTRENGFSITFEPLEGGRRLRVTRQIYAGGQSQPAEVQSVYDRTSEVAQWSVYNGSETSSANTGSISGDFIVPNGERIVASLNNDLTSNQAKAGDRFTMVVRQPGQYEGAVIEGSVASIDRGGRITGRSEMSLNFDTIRLRDGQSYRFAGIIEGVRTSNGETVQVDNEGGVAESDSRTQQTIQRGAIGTAIGAIIGAIAGGGKGAAIGAVVGAAGGAGSVYVQGQDDVELLSGSEVTIRASAPSR
ncbi:MAG: YMGG-like glycine zipper-containing protein [Pyrinomonadaceae bacterium]